MTKAEKLLKILKTSSVLNIQDICKVLEVNEREFRQVLRELEKAGDVKVNLQIEVLKK